MSSFFRAFLPWVALAFSTLAHASFPADSIPPSTRTEIITLDAPLTFPFTPAEWPIGAGLAAGEYRAEREDAEGVFYLGQRRAVIVRGLEGKTSEKRYALMVGGFWMPKGQKDPKPKLYFYVEKTFPSVNELSEITSPSLVPVATAGLEQNSGTQFGTTMGASMAGTAAAPNPGSAVAGGVIGGTIVDLIIRASTTGNEGKINFWWMPMNDKAFLDALNAAWKKGTAPSQP